MKSHINQRHRCEFETPKIDQSVKDSLIKTRRYIAYLNQQQEPVYTTEPEDSIGIATITSGINENGQYYSVETIELYQ